MALEMTDLEKNLLNEIQKDIPINPRPYKVMGEALGVSEEEILSAVKRLKEVGIIRQISGIFDTRSLGYQSSLVAAKIPADRLEEAAAVINTHPGVSHNYARNNPFNLWYTVAVPPNSALGLEKTVDLFHQLSGAESTRLMPTLKLYKIGVAFDVAGKDKPASQKEKPAYTDADRTPDEPLTEKEMEYICEMQEDLPVVEKPFEGICQKLDLPLEALAEMTKDLQKRGKLRRISAVLHHRKAGFTANAMGVWVVPKENWDEIGPVMGGFRAVSHCYKRPTYPDWPYSIFTMVHGKTAKECEEVLRAISEATGLTDYIALYSTKEFKKTRVRYFTPEMIEWEKEYAHKLSPEKQNA